MPKYKLIFYTPHASLEKVKTAIFSTSAGVFPPPPAKPLYTHCAFTQAGTGQFKPTAAAHPAIGTAGGELAEEPESRVEITCSSAEVTRAAVEKLKEAHPYEVPVYEVYKVEDF